MSKPELILPAKDGTNARVTLTCDDNVVIVGANGSGKSKLGAWIEFNSPAGTIVHRIAAQRALNFSQYVPLMGVEQAANILLWGNQEPIYSNIKHKRGHRWGNEPTTHLLSDYDNVLSLLFAREAERDSKYVKACRDANKTDSCGPVTTQKEDTDPQILRESNKTVSCGPIPIPDSPIDLLLTLWAEIMPNRTVQLEDSRIIVRTSEGHEYQGKDMSDGERVALYHGLKALLGYSRILP